MTSQATVNVCSLAWPGMDLLDFVGPAEVLSHVRDATRTRLNSVVIASDSELSETSQGVAIPRHIPIQDAISKIDTFDVLIVPGGGGFTAQSIPDHPRVSEAIQAFSQLPSRPAGRKRYLVSVCAGAFFLAQQGLLKGKTATCHYASLDALRTVCEEHGGSRIVRQHYVDCGDLEHNGMGVITSGGITSGIDAAFYLIEKVWDFAAAEKARATMDAIWRREALPYGF